MAVYTQKMTNTNYEIILTVTETSTSVANNTSDVSYKLEAKKYVGSGYFNLNAQSRAIVQINGVQHFNQLIAYDFRGSTPKTITITSGTATIPHNSDGSKTVRCIGSFVTPDAIGTAFISEDLTLTTIPRATTMQTPDSVYIESSYTFNLNPASSNFRHDLSFIYTNLETGGEQTIILGEDIYNKFIWDITSEYYNILPNTANGIDGFLKLDTYNGSTKIGTYSDSTFILVNPNISSPILTTTGKDVNEYTLGLTGDENKMLVGYSNIQIDVTQKEFKNNAVFKSLLINGTSVGNVDSYIINKATNNTITSTLTDSRGLTGSSIVQKEIVPYTKLTAVAKFERLDATSNTVKLSYNGNYFNGTFGETANTLELAWNYEIEKGIWSDYTVINHVFPANETIGFNGEVTLEGFEFDYRQEWKFRFYAVDKLENIIVTSVVKRGIPMWACNESKFVHFTDVYDSNWNKMGWSPTEIVANTDLNTITKLGTYNCVSDAYASSLTNSPTNNGFSMLVYRTVDNSFVQELTEYIAYRPPNKYFRTYYAYGNQWSEWIPLNNKSNIMLTRNTVGEYNLGQWSPQAIYMDKVLYQNGNFIHETGKVRVGKYIKRVKVSCQFKVDRLVSTTYPRFMKNNVMTDYQTFVQNTQTFTYQSYIFDVQEGDTLQLGMIASAAGAVSVAAGNYTTFTVEQLD